jgi:hypothetical protein
MHICKTVQDADEFIVLWLYIYIYIYTHTYILIHAGKTGEKGQKFRGVTWDKVKNMWRVRLCLAGGGREHIGYFADEEVCVQYVLFVCILGIYTYLGILIYTLYTYKNHKN